MSLYQRLKQLSDSSDHLPTECEILTEIKKPDVEGTCYICGGTIRTRSLCNKHHMFAIRHNINTLNRLEIKQLMVKEHKNFQFLRGNKCLACDEPTLARGLCRKHYRYISSYRYEVDINDPNLVKEFILKNQFDCKQKRCYICSKPIRAHDLCPTHLAYACNHNLDLKDKNAIKAYMHSNYPLYTSKLKNSLLKGLIEIKSRKCKTDEDYINKLIKDYEEASKHTLTSHEREIFFYAFSIGKLNAHINSSKELNNET